MNRGGSRSAAPRYPVAPSGASPVKVFENATSIVLAVAAQVLAVGVILAL